MKTSDFYKSKYLKAKDLEGPTNVTISEVLSETFNNSPNPKPVVHFKGVRKPLVLNKTNTQKLEDISGTDLMDNWPGVKAVLCPGITEVNGEQKPTIRIEAPDQKELPTRRPIKPSEPHGNGGHDDIADEIPDFKKVKG
jgi:hypothetical protein